MHQWTNVMHYDEEDPKSPRPFGKARKGDNAAELSEAYEWREVGPHRKGEDLDLHRHVSA